MPGAREVLQFILETDPTNAVKGFEAVEKSADKSLSKSEKSATSFGSTLTKVGAASMAAGAAVGVGLIGTVKTFEKAEESANKLDTAVKGMGSKIDTGQIQKLAFHLQQVADVTDNQVVSAARWGAIYGLTTQQLEKLLTVAVDLSAQTGQSLDATTKALARAASGGSDKVLVKWGVQMDETARKADAFGATTAAAMEFAGGAAAKASDTFSGQMDRMGHNFTDVKEQIGKGANEVFEPMAHAAANLSETLAKANPALLQTVGHFTAIGSVAATAFGGLASVAGQVANLREGFSGVGGVLDKFNISLSKVGDDGSKSLTNLGKAATGVGSALAALAVGDVVAGIGNAVTNTAGKAADDLNRFKIAAAGGKQATGDLMKSFQDLAKSQKLSVTGSFIDLGETLNRNEVDMGGVTTAARKANDAFDQLAKSSPAGAKALLDQLSSYTDTLDHNGHQYEVNRKFIDEHTKSLDLASKAAKANAGATGDAGAAAEDFTAALKDEHGALQFVALGAQDAAAAGKGLSDAFEAQDTDEQVASALKLGDALHGVKDSVKDLPGTFDAARAATGGYNDEQTKAIKAVMDWGDAAKGQIQTLIESKASNESVAASAAVYRDSLTSVMKQAGMTDAQINTYLTTLGLTPDQVNTAIQLSGDAEAKFKLSLYQDDLNKLPKDVQSNVRALIDQGHYAAAWDAMNSYKKGVEAPVKPVIAAEAMAAARASFLSQVGSWGGGRSAPAPTGAAVGVTPMAAIPVPVAPSQTNVTITLPAGTTPATTLRAIRRYQRLGGDMGGLLDTVAAIR